MNKNQRIVGSSILLTLGAIIVGFAFTGIDFAFGNDRWSEDHTSTLPLIGTISVDTQFQLSMIFLLLGLVILIIGARIAISNYSTIRNIWKVVAGIILIAWGIWGVAFSFNTIENRIVHGIDRVEIPCLDFCAFTSEEWLFLNFGMMGLGLILLTISTKQSRFITRTV